MTGFAQLRVVMEVMRSGICISLFQASQRIEDAVVGVQDPVAEKVAAQKRPDIFHRIEFRRIRRQWQQHDVARHLEPRLAVPAGAVEHQQGDGSHRDASAGLG
jgi:hypothetical protein